MENVENKLSATDLAKRLRELAQIVRQDPTARASIAEGFELIAVAMEPCEDCGRQATEVSDLEFGIGEAG